MSNPIIKFDHDFYKLRGQTAAQLIDFEVVDDSSELDPDMIALDVQYYVDVPLENDPDTTQKECRQVEIPTGRVVLLTFKGNKRIPFTTIRKYRKNKIEKYRRYDAAKQVFNVVINNKNNVLHKSVKTDSMAT